MIEDGALRRWLFLVDDGALRRHRAFSAERTWSDGARLKLFSVEDGALRRPLPRRAGGTYVVQRPATHIAPLNAARTAQRTVLYHCHRAFSTETMNLFGGPSLRTTINKNNNIRAKL